jgi:hypothetical protein
MKVNLDDVHLPLTVCLFDLRLLARFKVRNGSMTMEEIVCPNSFLGGEQGKSEDENQARDGNVLRLVLLTLLD